MTGTGASTGYVETLGQRVSLRIRRSMSRKRRTRFDIPLASHRCATSDGFLSLVPNCYLRLFDCRFKLDATQPIMRTARRLKGWRLRQRFFPGFPRWMVGEPPVTEQLARASMRSVWRKKNWGQDSHQQNRSISGAVTGV